jgi:hypothetical protein
MRLIFLGLMLASPVVIRAAENAAEKLPSANVTTVARIPYPEALAASAVTVDSLVNPSKQGLVVGNGELNAIIYSVGDELRLRLAKND